MMKQENNQPGAVSRTIMLVCVTVAIIATATVIVVYSTKTPASSFQECKDEGGTITEGDAGTPDTCEIDGMFFEEALQSSDGNKAPDTNDAQQYIGLDEEAAMKLAEKNNETARVVERDGEALTVTMDLREGRLNFTVKDGKVTGVDVETVGARESQAQ